MKTKSLLLGLTAVLACGSVASVALLSENETLPSYSTASEYSLTIDQSNFSNFTYVEENLYRGTFKTALGNDVTFTTNKDVNILDNKIYWTNGNYLKNDNALSGLNKIEVSAEVSRG